MTFTTAAMCVIRRSGLELATTRPAQSARPPVVWPPSVVVVIKEEQHEARNQQSVVVVIKEEQRETRDQQEAEDEEPEVTGMLRGRVEVRVAAHEVLCVHTPYEPGVGARAPE